jgi:phage terminase large subunit
MSGATMQDNLASMMSRSAALPVRSIPKARWCRSEKKSKDFFANAKAQAWWHLRLLFQNTYRAVENKLPIEDPDRLISIDPNLPELQQLMMELSQPTYSLNSVGKILVDKSPAGLRSPNLADAVMIAFNPAHISMEIWMKLAND